MSEKETEKKPCPMPKTTIEAEQDDFWDIDMISPPAIRRFTDCEPVEITSEAPSEKNRSNEEMIPKKPNPVSKPSTVSPSYPKTNIGTYYPNHCVVTQVDVAYRSFYVQLYRQFGSAVIRYGTLTGYPCDYVPLNLLNPQYSMLSPSQLMYYFYFRDCCRKRIAVTTDRSYILLLCYEIFNGTPEITTPQEGLNTLVFLWLTYRNRISSLDSIFANWIADYLLLYRLDLPENIPQQLRDIGSQYCYIFGYYFTEDEPLLRLASISSYRYTNSKHYAKYAEEYDKHMNAILSSVKLNEAVDPVVLHRDRAFLQHEAFAGAVITGERARWMTVHYDAYKQNQLLRNIIGSVIRYTDNCIRTLLGIRGKLTVVSLPPQAKQAVDSYFAPFYAAMPQTEKAVLEKQEAAYMEQYEAKEPFSLENAKNLEKASWQVTSMLVGDTEENEAEPEVERITSKETKETEQTTENGMIARAVGILLGREESTLESMAKEISLPVMTLAEEVNRFALSLYGDIAVEEANGKLSLIDCYRQDLEEWLDGTSQQ